jgi:prevent-host-death family protein
LEGIVEKTVQISDFKTRCLRLADEVAVTGQPILLTRHGRPLVRVVPVEEPASLKGSVTFLVSDEELMAPLDEDWDADR